MSAFLQTLVLLITIYEVILLIRIFATWIPPLQTTAFFFFLVSITEPFLAPFRRILPPLGFFDLSPILAFLVLEVLKRILMGMV